MAKPKKPTPTLALLRTIPQGCDDQGRTSPRAQTFPSGKTYKRRPKNGRWEDQT